MDGRMQRDRWQMGDKVEDDGQTDNRDVGGRWLGGRLMDG